MYFNIFLFAGMENDVSDLYTRERQRERERVYFRFAKLSRHIGKCMSCDNLSFVSNGAHAEYFRSDVDLSRTRACRQ